MLTKSEKTFLVDILERKPREVLEVLAGQMLTGITTAQQQPPAKPEPIPAERRAGDDPFLIDEDEFSYRARSMSADEQAVLRCRVNAARMQKQGSVDQARRFRQRADRLERKLMLGE